MATPNPNQSADGWTLVTRRRRPPHFLSGPHSPPKHTQALNPRSPTYAQVLQKTPNSPQRTNSKPADQDNQNTYVQLPHSPTNLRYPPNPHYREWWGRCFRCAKKGHVVAECTMPRTNKMVTKETPPVPRRPLVQSNIDLSTGVQSDNHQTNVLKRPRLEPSFEEFLAQPEPQEEAQMPSFRPTKVQCYVNRDEHYYQSLQKFLSGIVLHPPESLKKEMNLDHAAQAVANSGKVNPNQLQVARMSHDRFLVLLPQSIDRDEVVAAIPQEVWDKGFTFQPYSPLMDASVSIPFFKLWIDIHQVPIELHTESHMAKVVSSFGIYLGSLEPEIIGDCQTWSIFLATDDLASVPLEIDIKIGGMVFTAKINPRKWIKGQVFHRADLPPTTVPYRRPEVLQLLPGSSSQTATAADPIWFQEDDVIPMSLTALREIFRQFAPSELPPDLAACLAGDPQAIAANHEAGRVWERDRQRRWVLDQDAQHGVTPHVATANPTSPLMRVNSQLPATKHSQTTQMPATAHGTTNTSPDATVHRTADPAPPSTRHQPDLSLQVLASVQHLSGKDVAQTAGMDPKGKKPVGPEAPPPTSQSGPNQTHESHRTGLNSGPKMNKDVVPAQAGGPSGFPRPSAPIDIRQEQSTSPTTGSTAPFEPSMPDMELSDGQEDDPYLDRVDYSDDDLGI